MNNKSFTVKVISLVVVVLFAFVTFSGCGSSSAPAAAGPEESAVTPEESAAVTEQKDPASFKADITVWTWETQENQQKIIDEFNKDYPNIKVTFSNVDTTDMARKLQTSLAAGSDMPDIAWLEDQLRGKLLAMDCWENLEAAPYNLDRSNILDYMLPLSSNSSGQVVGVEVSPAVSGLAYKRELAKQYFGTDDPKELEKIFTSWNVLIQKGEEVKQKSNGSVYMFAGLLDVLEMLKGQNTKPYVVDNKLNLKESVAPMLSILVDMNQKGMVDKLNRWTAPWNASHADKTHIFYPCATWSPTWVIKANDPEGKGRWGLMIPPGGSFPMGGTIVAIPQKAKNKEAAFEYIKWTYLSEKGAVVNRDTLEYFSTIKSTYQNPDFYSKPDEYFAGQDILKTFAQDILPKMIQPKTPFPSDQEVNDAIVLAVSVITSSTDGNVNVDELIGMMQDDIISKVPDLQKE